MEHLEQTKIVEKIGAARAALVRRRQDGRLLFCVLWRQPNAIRRPSERDFAGGQIEGGETWADAIARETREETRMQVPPESFRYVGAHTTQKAQPQGLIEVTKQLSVAYVSEDQAASAGVGDTSEHSHLDWLTQEQAEAYFVDSETNLLLIAEAARLILTGELEPAT